jgi:predicted phosphoribosyltransferase
MTARFSDRKDAGIKLNDFLGSLEFDVIAAIPRGGVELAVEIARRRKKPVLIVGVRKIPIPWNIEAGFGAIAEDGSIFLNKSLLSHLQISSDEVSRLAEEVRREVIRRIDAYRKGREIPNLSGRRVLLVDDGFASGYTAIAAIELLKKKGAVVYAAAPCSPSDTVNLLKKYADEVIVIQVQRFGAFAVASYYEDFRDLTDEEVIESLKEVENL